MCRFVFLTAMVIIGFVVSGVEGDAELLSILPQGQVNLAISG